MTNSVNVQEVQWCTWGDDNNGRIFLYRGEYYRGIRPASEALFRRLLDEGILDELSAAGLLVSTCETDLELDGYAMVLKHETVPFVSYPQEWCFSMLRDAGKCILNLNRRLLPHGLAIVDGHARNVLFRGTKPVFVDVGSIVECRSELPFCAYQEFQSCVVYPLLLQQKKGLSRVLTFLLSDSLRGISGEEYHSLRGSLIPPFRFRLFGRSLNAEAMNDRVRRRFLNSDHALLRGLGKWLCRLPPLRPSAPVAAAIDQLERQLDDVTVVQDLSQWGDYDSGSATGAVNVEQLKKREANIYRAMSKISPSSLIDLAGNQGMFSRMAAQCGVENIVCADYDLTAVEKHYVAGKASNSKILPVCLNVMKPCAGATGVDFERHMVHRRFQCDMALALALTHHLSLTQRVPFDTIAETLAKYTRRHLLVEFMPFGLGLGEPSADLPDWYHLDAFRDAFSRFFSEIEVFESDMEGNQRILLVCEK